MTHSVRISLCLAAISLAALSACSQPAADAGDLTLDATSIAKYQKSLIKIESHLSSDEKLALTKAIGALEAYPLDGNCDVNNVLAHIRLSADPAFRQKLRLRRLHGLTAEQVIDQAEEKNCNSELAAQAVPACAPMIMMEYKDFGPQAMAYDFIGYERRQWKSTDGNQENKNHPIKIVVYTESEKNNAIAKFPIDQDARQDFRYVSVDAAREYLEENLADIKGEATLDVLSQTLEKTKTRLNKEICPT